jgi:hypothetical protein
LSIETTGLSVGCPTWTTLAGGIGRGCPGVSVGCLWGVWGVYHQSYDWITHIMRYPI